MISLKFITDRVSKFLFCAALLCFATVAQAQLPPHDCGNTHLAQQGAALKNPPPNANCSKQSSDFLYYFQKKENFMLQAPILPQNTVKKVKVRFMIADPGTPTKKNFRQEDIPALQDIIYWLNGFFQSTAAPTKPQTNICGTCHIPDTRIRFELEGITFFNSTIFSGYYIPDLTSEVIGGDSVLNIFFGYYDTPSFAGITNPYGDISKFAFHNNPSTNYIVVSNLYQRYLNNDLWTATIMLMHEMFHEYGLWHLFDGTESCTETDPDYLKDIFNTGASQHCPLTGGFNDCNPASANYPNVSCNNNVMSIGGYTWTSPMQLGIIHRESFMGRMHQYTFPTEAPTLNPWFAGGNEVWDFGIRMYQDIRILPGRVLTIKCDVEMPLNGRIVIERGGKLIIDGGRITSYHNNTTWQGIEVVGNMNQVSDPMYQGYLELKNNAIIENASIGVRNFSWENGAQGGGIIKASNSTFHNCWRSVELNGYYAHSYGNLYSSTTNCSFDGVTFTIDDACPLLASHNWDGGDLFTSYDTKTGVLIKNCTFKNEIPYSMQPEFKRGRAIYMLGTGVKVINTAFDGFKNGIYLSGYTGIPTRNAIIYDNRFDNITSAITIAAGTYSDIRNNRIQNMTDYTLNPPNGPFTMVFGSGIYLDNTQGSFVGCGNQVDGFNSQNPSFNSHFGVVVNRSGTTGAVVKRNNFINLMTGIQTQRNNQNLTISCNQFENNYTGMAINPQSNHAFYYLKDQGTGCGSGEFRAGNSFVNNTKDIASYLSNPWNYYFFTSNSSYEQYPYNSSGNFYLTDCNFGTATSDPNTQCSGFWDCIRISAGIGHFSNRSDYNTLVAAGQKATLNAQILRNLVIQGYNEQDDAPGLQAFLEAENDDNARRLLIPLYIERALYSKVASTIAQMALPANELTGYTDYYNIIMNLQQQGRDISMLDPQELQTIHTLATNDLEVSAYAKAILEWSYNEPWDHPIEEESAAPASRPGNKMHAPSENSKLYDASPNPAKGVTTITAFISDEDVQRQPILLIHSITGKEMSRHLLQKGRNSIEINTGQFATGLYVYSLSLNGKVKESKKLSVVK